MTAQPYQYVCPRTGTVKAFKQMSARRAADLNRKLAATGGAGRWVLRPPAPHAQTPAHPGHLPPSA